MNKLQKSGVTTYPDLVTALRPMIPSHSTVLLQLLQENRVKYKYNNKVIRTCNTHIYVSKKRVYIV